MWTNAVFSGRWLHISFIIDAKSKHVELANVARLPDAIPKEGLSWLRQQLKRIDRQPR